MSDANFIRRSEGLGALAAALHAAALAALFARGAPEVQWGTALLGGATAWSWLRRGFRPRPWLPFGLLLLYAAAEAVAPRTALGLTAPGVAFAGLLLAALLAHGRWTEALDPSSATRAVRAPHDDAEDRAPWGFEELARLLALAAGSAAAGLLLLALAPRLFFRRLYDAMPEGAADLLAVAALALLAVAAARAALGLLRRLDLDPARAELQLYDLAWREHAGELARQSRWFAWAERRAAAKEGVTAPAASPDKSRPPP